MTTIFVNMFHGLYLSIFLLVSMGRPHLTTGRAARPQTYTLPTFVDTDRNLTIEVGDTARLPCELENLGPKTVIWKKTDQAHPISIGTYIYVPDSNYVVEHKENTRPLKSSEWSLVIHNVQIHNAGVYECQISAKEDIMRNITLNVVERKEEHPGIQLGGTLYVEIGSEINLKCSASAIDYLPLDVDWFKDGLKIKPKTESRVSISKYPSRETNTLNSTLIIQHSKMSDAGTYVCRISKLHVASLKVMVLNAETYNVKRGTFKDDVVVDQDKMPHRSDNAGQTIQSSCAWTLLWTTLCILLKRLHCD